MLKNLVTMKAIAVGTIGGAFGCVHVDPDNEEARIVRVTEAAAVELEKKRLAVRQQFKMVDEGDEGDEIAPVSANKTTAIAERLENADHGHDQLNTGADTRDTTAYQKDPLATAAAASGEAEKAGDADAAPIDEVAKEPAKEEAKAADKETAKGTVAAKEEAKAAAKS